MDCEEKALRLVGILAQSGWFAFEHSQSACRRYFRSVEKLIPVAAPTFTKGRGQTEQGAPKRAWYIRFRNCLLLIILTSEC